MFEEPETVKDAKNAVGYFVMLGFMTCGVFLLFGGMFCPYFWSYAKNRYEELAKEKHEQNPDGESYETILATYRGRTIFGMVLWFVSAWLFFIFVICNYNYL